MVKTAKVVRGKWEHLGIGILHYSHGSFKSWLAGQQPQERKISHKEIKVIAKKIGARTITVNVGDGMGGGLHRMLAVGPISNVDAISLERDDFEVFLVYEVDRKNWRLKVSPRLLGGNFQIHSSRSESVDDLDDKILDAIDVRKQILKLPEPIVYLPCPLWVSQEDNDCGSHAVGSYVFRSEAKKLVSAYWLNLNRSFGLAGLKRVCLNIPSWVNPFVLVSSHNFVSENIAWGIARELVEVYTKKVTKELRNPQLYCIN